MASDLTLPGDLPGLLRRGSPVVVSGEEAGGWHYPAAVAEGGATWATVWSPIHRWASGRFPLAALDLDLTDRTARVHAAWWAQDRGAGETIMRPEHRRALGLALAGEPMTDDEIAALRALCLRLAEEVADAE